MTGKINEFLCLKINQLLSIPNTDVTSAWGKWKKERYILLAYFEVEVQFYTTPYQWFESYDDEMSRGTKKITYN